MSIYEERFSNEIIITTNNIKEQCEKFLNNLIKNTKEFKKQHNKYKKEFDDLKNKGKEKNKRIIFTPENILNSSPITLIDAPWGSGKTFFIENLCEYILSGEIELDYIDKIILIDAWKYSTSTMMPDDFIDHLLNELTRGYKTKMIIKIWIANLLVSIRPIISLTNSKFLDTIMNFFICLLQPKSYIKKDIEYFIKKINKKFTKPILVVVDNIERIGSGWWEIIKIIQKLVALDNFIFVIPMYKEKLKLENGSEWSIDKYISIPSYTLKNDYACVLKKHNFKHEYLNDLTNLLNEKVNGEVLNLRQLSNLLSSNLNDRKFSNKYEMLYWFENNIWPSEKHKSKFRDDFLNRIVRSDIDKLNKNFLSITSAYEMLVTDHKELNLKHIKINEYVSFGTPVIIPTYKCYSTEIKDLIKIINYSFEKLEKIGSMDKKDQQFFTRFKIAKSNLTKIKNNVDESYLNNIMIEISKEYLDKVKMINVGNGKSKDFFIDSYFNNWSILIENKLIGRINYKK